MYIFQYGRVQHACTYTRAHTFVHITTSIYIEWTVESWSLSFVWFTMYMRLAVIMATLYSNSSNNNKNKNSAKPRYNCPFGTIDARCNCKRTKILCSVEDNIRVLLFIFLQHICHASCTFVKIVTKGNLLELEDAIFKRHVNWLSD